MIKTPFHILQTAKKFTKFKSEQVPENIYDSYVDYLKNRKLDLTKKTQILEKHHVTPLHKSKIKRGSQEDKNQEKIIVTYEEHNLLHFYHYLVYQLPGDFLFLQLRQNIDVDKAKLSRELGGKNAGKLNTPAQKKQRRKFLKLHPENLNPSKAGSVQSPAQKAQSAKLGKTYGRQAGISRQNAVTKHRIQQPMTWVHQSGVEVFIEKAETLHEIMNILNNYVPRSVKFTSGLSNIVRKIEKRRYGWILLDNENINEI